MKTTLAMLFCFTSWFTTAATTSSLTDAQLLQIRFDQKLNAQVSPDLIFTDDHGKQARLGDYLGKKPVVLVLGYYGCPMLCTLVLNGATEAFRGLKWTAGEQFEVIFVSIDPHETPALAAEKKKNCLKNYGRGPADGWHFLTGETTAIQTLTDEIGFRFAYDPAAKEFAHPSGIVILTPTGKIARYLLGVTFSPEELDTALRAAAAEKAGPPASPLALLCFHYAPLVGKYGKQIMLLVRLGGVATVFALGAVFLLSPSQRKPGK